jgi:hypothetical protein
LVKTGTRIDQLEKFVGKDKAKEIEEVIPFIGKYFEFKSMSRMGITYSPQDLDYKTALIFSWIEESINGNGHRVPAQGHRR